MLDKKFRAVLDMGFQLEMKMEIKTIQQYELILTREELIAIKEALGNARECDHRSVEIGRAGLEIFTELVDMGIW